MIWPPGEPPNINYIGKHKDGKKVNVFQPHDYGGKTIKYELFSKNYEGNLIMERNGGGRRLSKLDHFSSFFHTSVGVSDHTLCGPQSVPQKPNKRVDTFSDICDISFDDSWPMCNICTYSRNIV